jgi:hypothetical protein
MLFLIKVEEISTIETSIKCTFGDFKSELSDSDAGCIFGFDAWIDIDRMILQNNFKIFHLDKDVKLSFP